jgi:peptide/nickel transport system substrate-binding protein
MEMEKKNVAIIVLAIALVASGVGNIIFGVQLGLQIVPPEFPSNIIFGTMYGPADSDPQYMWDSASFDYAYQVWEGLWAYNLSDPDVPMIPRLATDFGTWSGANLTVTLQQGVTFHTGTKFNATAVKFSMDRLLYLTNLTGAQPGSGPGSTVYGESIITVLYMWPDGTSVLNRTEIIDEYTVKFVLNKPYGVFLPLMTFTASMMLDPSITPADDYISEGMAGATGETVSGTGPWKFQYYIAGVEAKFVRNDDYWRGAGAVEELFFSVIQDSDARNNALLAGDVNILDSPHPSYYDTMRADPNIDLYEAGPGTITQYLGFNNKLLNKTWRSAMSWAIDYDYMIDELLEGEAVRLKSPIPLGIQYADWSFDVPVLNLTKARSFMHQMGLGTTFTTDAEWIAVAESGTPFYTVNFTYNLGNKFREDMYVLLESDFKYIGIKVEDAGQEWDPYLDRLYNRDLTAEGYPGLTGWNALQIWFIGWMPDYNDPSNYVNSLMSNVSSSNSAQINDPTLEAYMLAGLEETDQGARETIYANLQQYVVEDLQPWAFGYVGRNHDAWFFTLEGYPSNGMGYICPK